MLLEWTAHVRKKSPKLFGRIFPKWIANQRDCHKVAANVLTVVFEPRPVPAGKKRITSHGVVRRIVRNLSLDQPSAAGGKFTRPPPGRKRTGVSGMEVAGHVKADSLGGIAIRIVPRVDEKSDLLGGHAPDVFECGQAQELARTKVDNHTSRHLQHKQDGWI